MTLALGQDLDVLLQWEVDLVHHLVQLPAGHSLEEWRVRLGWVAGQVDPGIRLERIEKRPRKVDGIPRLLVARVNLCVVMDPLKESRLAVGGILKPRRHEKIRECHLGIVLGIQMLRRYHRDAVLSNEEGPRIGLNLAASRGKLEEEVMPVVLGSLLVKVLVNTKLHQ